MNRMGALSCFESFELSDREFELLSRFIYEKCGINLGDCKRALLRARLTSRLRALGLRSFKEYYKFVSEDDTDGSELVRMLDAISTNLTEFFRESPHFDYLAQTVYPRWQHERTIRILSAGCSSGEEPYSIAISALNFFQSEAQQKIRISAGDLSCRMLAKAHAGVYPMERTSKIDKAQLHRYFLRGTGPSEGLVRVVPEVRKLIHFERINLTTELPFTDLFHVIFCRNVAIYFDRATQDDVFSRLGKLLVQGGTMFVGHSESMSRQRTLLQYIQPTVYERI